VRTDYSPLNLGAAPGGNLLHKREAVSLRHLKIAWGNLFVSHVVAETEFIAAARTTITSFPYQKLNKANIPEKFLEYILAAIATKIRTKMLPMTTIKVPCSEIPGRL
jgi:hypothetical protein